ncbi:hypothetical protein [Falsirhodobacter algicola]|uniref:Uncharacterized protein n=1 Tax=Falsirhodobacter algicola TaxID=2692330 RepID=A0A8J8MTG9_9RHOB|nr:hypothetical protein [Falsirhodobacter algicola]QUS36407.1 hypothetical protein GR316_09125 [Falsirhodobacter algicola]
MFRATTRRLALAGAALTLAALPVHAAMPPAMKGETVDLAYYDSISRTGTDQLPTDPYCAAPDMLAADLGEAYQEDIVLTAMNPDGTQFDVWASGAAGTWTVSYTRADGIACVIGSGTDWSTGDDASARLTDVGLPL